MSDALLDYFFKVSLSVATSLANTGYLHNALAIVKAKDGAQTNTITFVENATQASQFTNDEAVQHFMNASTQGIYLLAVEMLEDAEPLINNWTDGFTILIGDDFTELDISTLQLGGFKGVVAANFVSQAEAKTFAAKANHCAYNGDIRNMFYAFGKLLSDNTWNDQQAITLPVSDGVTTSALAESKFNDRVSFGLDSEQYGTRLAFLVAGGQAIRAPYVIEEIKINLQSEWLRYASVNKPNYTIVDAKLVQQDLQTRVMDQYINDGQIDYGTVTVDLAKDEFEASSQIDMQRPRAWWRIKATIQAE